MEFFLGINEPYWLAHCDFPLMVARQRLFRPGKQRRPLPVARHRWVLDSGGFTQLHQHGRYPFTADQYASEIETLDNEVGNLAWASPMDWMCEEGALSQTGLTVPEHQRRTVENFIELRERLGTLVIPVLQGWERDDYLRCVDLYEAAGVDLSRQRVVGLGSVCRRNATNDIASIVTALDGLNLHAYGVKGHPLRLLQDRLISADSMAWSFAARFGARHPDCGHWRCTDCRMFATYWRENLLTTLR